MGGNKSRGYEYAGSSTVGDVAWYDSNSGSKTQEVGKKAPNELGLYDMSGNLWEWCSDWFGNYSSSAQTNPYNSIGSCRVFRGGSWYCRVSFVWVAYRDNVSPSATSSGLGLRIARALP
ncbi:formylglycine-generating enzyme family protein [Mesotoga sp. UBA5557]|jgi:formylglycine-generating enzyme required for sulfatase activity|uniref:formylglycine-generating enzyme family protein n=1 Tax=Mesotoga sp. UBA5557 TaxID=1946857 RepID=UPI000A77A1CC|nr:SUMF1/EgtB/PvdO family nonheme iron enzyme [Mesotoga sp. UBA5557]